MIPMSYFVTTQVRYIAEMTTPSRSNARIIGVVLIVGALVAAATYAAVLFSPGNRQDPLPPPTLAGPITSTTTSTMEPVSVNFDEPKTQIVTESGFPVSGSSSGLRSSDRIWLVTIASPRGEGDTFQPQDKACILSESGRFDCGMAYVGGPTDTGKTFEVGLYRVTDSAIETFMSYNQSDPAALGYPGLQDLPPGSEKIGFIEVQRQ